MLLFVSLLGSQSDFEVERSILQIIVQFTLCLWALPPQTVWALGWQQLVSNTHTWQVPNLRDLLQAERASRLLLSGVAHQHQHPVPRVGADGVSKIHSFSCLIFPNIFTLLFSHSCSQYPKIATI